MSDMTENVPTQKSDVAEDTALAERNRIHRAIVMDTLEGKTDIVMPDGETKLEDFHRRLYEQHKEDRRVDEQTQLVRMREQSLEGELMKDDAEILVSEQGTFAVAAKPEADAVIEDGKNSKEKDNLNASSSTVKSDIKSDLKKTDLKVDQHDEDFDHEKTAEYKAPDIQKIQQI